MSAFDEWWPRTPERFSDAREDIARAAYVAGMEQAARVVDDTDVEPWLRGRRRRASDSRARQ